MLFSNKGPSSQGYGFSSSYVWMWELDYKESWTLKNWCFWIVVLEKTLESLLDCKEVQPVHPKGNPFCSVRLLSHVQLFATPWIAAHKASLYNTNSWSLLKFMSIESVMPSNYLILCRPLLLLPPIPSSIRVFSNESALHIRWPKYWSFSFRISPSMNLQDWFPLGWTGWISLLSKCL